MKTSNPIISEKVLRNYAFDRSGSEVMTLQGTINKIALMLALVLAGSLFTWNLVSNQDNTAMIWMIGGGIGAFITAIVIFFNKKSAPIAAPIYAVLEGLFLGAISAFFEAMFPNVVMRAVLLTFAVLFMLLFAYKTQIIKVTDKFRAGVFAATMGIAAVYFISFILRLFGVNMDFMFGGGTFAIVLSLVIIVVAALNLVLDFDFIEKGSQSGLPKYFEWYGAFGLMVTLIWLYLEILRLLAMLSGRD
jgi:uncharacterized YccA/Bax inhibitor family protein